MTKDMGERIAKRRNELGMNQTQLAERLGYSDKTAISKIENGISHLNDKKIDLFADVLQTSTAYLMGWTDNPDISEENAQAIQEANRLQRYANYIIANLHSGDGNGKPIPEDIAVFIAYRQAPQHIKDAIKAMLQIKEE